MLKVVLTSAADRYTAALTTAVSVTGGLGNDSLTGSDLADALFGEDGNDRLTGGLGDDQLSGGAGNDYIASGGGNDTLMAGGGNDTLYADDGNDEIWLGTALAGPGPGLISGGAGIDKVRLVGAVATSSLSLSGVEHLDFGGFDLSGSAGNDVFTFSDVTTLTGTRLIRLNEGNDRFTGSAGADSVEGGAGNDNLTGNAGHDWLDGGAGNDTLTGGDGDDTLASGTGADSLNGGNGNDLFHLGAAGGGAVRDIAGGTGTDIARLCGALATDRFYLTTVELLDTQGFAISGTAGADYFSITSLTSITGARAFALLAGDDSFYGSATGDTAEGGDGKDSLFGQDGHDRLDGGAGDDSLSGQNGDDTLVGGGGTDNFSGGAGNDELRPGSAAGPVAIGTINGDTGTDRVVLMGAIADSSLSLMGIEALDYNGFNLSGTALADTISLGLVVEVMGARLIALHAGADTFTGSESTDHVDGGADNDSLSGGRGNDTISGGAGIDQVIGGSGNDLLAGGADNDTIFGDDGFDTVDYSAAAGPIKATLTFFGGSATGEGADTFYAVEALQGSRLADTLVGNTLDNRLAGLEGADSLFGDDGRDTLDGGAGNDTVDGGLGDDTLLVSAGTDRLTGGTGIDLLDFSGVGAFTLTLGGTGFTGAAAGQSYTGFEDVRGSALADNITGDAGANRLEGGLGHDTLAGGAGNDRLEGGVGNDRLTGGTGADLFVYRGPLASLARDSITDFTPVDDGFEIDVSDFGGGLVAGGVARLIAGASPVATGTTGVFLYNTTTGILAFDADGAGAGTGVQFAALAGLPVLTAADFVLVA